MSADLAKPQKELQMDDLPKEIVIDGQKVRLPRRTPKTLPHPP